MAVYLYILIHLDLCTNDCIFICIVRLFAAFPVATVFTLKYVSLQQYVYHYLVYFNLDYPFKPPKFNFGTPVYHADVVDGNVNSCVDILPGMSRRV